MIKNAIRSVIQFWIALFILHICAAISTGNWSVGMEMFPTMISIVFTIITFIVIPILASVIIDCILRFLNKNKNRG